MSALVETMAFTGELPWHGLGVEVGADLSPKEMLNEAGLSWQVEKRPMFVGNPEVEHLGPVKSKRASSLVVPGMSALVRMREGLDEVLGVCGSQYQVTQNEQVFEFFSKFVKSGHMRMHTAGSLDKGRRVWGLASMCRGFTLPGGDEVHGYLLLAHPHIWGEAMQIKFTNIRVVCNNTYSMAIKEGGGFRMAHTYVFDSAMAAKAEEALGLATEQLDGFEESAKFLAKTKYTEEAVVTYLAELFKMRAPLEDYVPANLNRTALTVFESLETQPGHDLKSAKGTWWGAFNAVTHAVDHRLGNSRDTALTSAWFGSREGLKQRAFSRALDYAKAA